MSARGSSRKADKLREKRNRPPQGEPWAWLSRELIESDAWRTALINTRKVVDRLMLEHMAHGGTENGNLVVTYDDFMQSGFTRRATISAAIKDAHRRGLIDITRHGKASAGLDRWPSRYALGWLPHSDGGAARNRWREHKRRRRRRRRPVGGSSASTAEQLRPQGLRNDWFGQTPSR
jgi:hypothetical protein